MKYSTILCLTLCLSLSHMQAESRIFRAVSYNVENLFDCIDDSLTNDQEFLPEKGRNWNYQRYQTKLAHIARVITHIGEWDSPALVALCEIENDRCLKDLTSDTGLKNAHYKYLHFESPDPRGIDVALLYQPTKFRPIKSSAIPIRDPKHPTFRTRDILLVTGLTPTNDTLHVFVCHFPSRATGELETESKRILVASVLKTQIDSLQQIHRNLANIMLMGDFNDYPTDKSLHETLGAQQPEYPLQDNVLYNLMYNMHLAGKGSHKHEGVWGALDQIIVSGTLLQKHKFKTSVQDVHLFDEDYLLEDDVHFYGKEPFRTYNGMKYQDGYSDHLPVYVDFKY